MWQSIQHTEQVQEMGCQIPGMLLSLLYQIGIKEEHGPNQWNVQNNHH